MQKKLIAPLLVMLSLFAISPLMVDAWFFAHDSAVHLVRLNDVSYQMADGNFYPRWLSLSCLGKGSPALNFYAPAFYLVTGYLHYFGLPLLSCLKIVCFGYFLLGSVGMYLWTGKHVGRVGAALSATLYLFAPYHFLDLYVRGAMPEFAALAFLPFLFHAMDLALADDRNARGVAYTALASALIVLHHNLSALMILPFALAYFGWRSVSVKAPGRRILTSCLGPVFGAGISAFYWLPVLLEQKHLGNLTSIVSGVFQYQKNFLAVSDWFNFTWGFEGFEGPPNGMSFQLGYVLLLCLLVAAAALTRDRSKRSFGMITLSLGLASLLMTTSYASFVYQLLPPFRYVQFPWRFMGPATLFLSAFSGAAVHLLPESRQELCRVAFCAAAIVLCIALSTEQRRVKEQLPVPLDDKGFRTYGQPLFTFATEDEYLPKGVTISVKARPRNPLLIGSDGARALQRFDSAGSRMTCSVSGGQSSQLVLPWFYFPGWQATCDGRSVPVSATPQGMIAVAVPAGDHTVEVSFGTTPPRVTGWLLSLTALVLLGAWIRSSTKQPVSG